MKSAKQYFNSNNDFAIGAYNFVNYETLRGICEGCKRTNSPSFLSVSASAIEYLGENFLLALFEAAKKEYEIPLFLHLDHGKTFEICKKAIELGFDSVMYDGSSHSFKENVAVTKKVASLAHKNGVLVEAELGVLAGIEDDINKNASIFTDPKKAKDFVEQTKCDSLAVAIGTSHGAYKFKGEQKICFDVLEEIETEIPKTPLVLHGASSVPKTFVDKINKFGGNIVGAKGIPETMLAEAAKNHHIFKINTDTDIRLCSTATLREDLSENPSNFDLRQPNRKIIEEIAKFVAEKNSILNCVNKA